MALINLNKKFEQIKNAVANVNFADVQLPESFKIEYEKYLNENRANGYVNVEWTKFSTKITSFSGKTIFLTNFWFYIASELSNYMDDLSRQRDIFGKIYQGDDLQAVATSLRDGINNEDRNKIQQYFSENSFSENELKYFLSFVSDYKSWGGGKTIDRNDYYVSPLLSAGNLLAETQSAIAEIAKQMSECPSLKNSFTPIFASLEKSYAKSLVCKNNIISKPFLLLAGISGTGKTRFVREQAKLTGAFNDTYCLTSVRPDWHEPSDLLGYISRLNGQAEYVTTDVLQFIAKAWCGIADVGLSIETRLVDKQGERLVVSGERDALENIKPYWLCLDEMNLAPVEQYFADYLSVLETREWHWEGDDFTYSCDALLKSATINELDDKSKLKLKKELGFENANYEELWQLICKYGLSIPFNLIVAGTVNMDETTHGFSRKVIDRALSFDFGEFFPNDYDEFFAPNSRHKSLSYPILSHVTQADLDSTFDLDGKKSIDFLKSVNSVLKNTPFELAYRALNELLLAVVSAQPQDIPTLHAVWDDFLMCKVLPRIEGDQDKLDNNPSLLEKLSNLLKETFGDDFWSNEQARPDLYRERITADDTADEDKIILVACRSRIKLNWMQERLDKASFTSFWP